MSEAASRPNRIADVGARERILDAAEKRLLQFGPAGLVLDAVARQAEVSKGGLLYHFPSKEALIDGLTDRMFGNFDRLQASLAEGDPDERGRWTRAYLAGTVDRRGEPIDASARLMASLLAVIGTDSSRLEAVRARFAQWQSRLETDGIDATTATIVRLAADGLWLSALLGLPRLESATHTRVFETLLDLTRR